MNTLQKKSGKITRKYFSMHQLVFQKGGLQDGTVLGYYFNNKKLLEGYKKGDRIVCGCCDTEVKASKFEAHAGCAKRRKPYHNIRTSDGVSLHKLAKTLKERCEKSLGASYSANMNKSVSRYANFTAARGLSGSNIVQQNSEPSIKILDLCYDVAVCALCRAHDYCTSDFSPRVAIYCDQCEMGFHVSCLKKYEIDDLKETPEGKWLCGEVCQRINTFLDIFVDCGEFQIPETLLVSARERTNLSPDLNVKWRLLKGQFASSDADPLLSKSVAIFGDLFGSLNGDLVKQMVYGEKYDDYDCRGMYCAVLTVNSAVVSTMIFRVFGHEVAEIPLVATPNEYQDQGYFRMLFSCIVNALASLTVEKMVLPSSEKTIPFWTTKFGFTRMEDKKFKNLRNKHSKMIIFSDTTTLERRVLKLEERSTRYSIYYTRKRKRNFPA